MNRLLVISSCIFLFAACSEAPQTFETRTCRIVYTGDDLEDEAKALSELPDA